MHVHVHEGQYRRPGQGPHLHAATGLLARYSLLLLAFLGRQVRRVEQQEQQVLQAHGQVLQPHIHLRAGYLERTPWGHSYTPTGTGARACIHTNKHPPPPHTHTQDYRSTLTHTHAHTRTHVHRPCRPAAPLLVRRRVAAAAAGCHAAPRAWPAAPRFGYGGGARRRVGSSAQRQTG